MLGVFSVSSYITIGDSYDRGSSQYLRTQLRSLRVRGFLTSDSDRRDEFSGGEGAHRASERWRERVRAESGHPGRRQLADITRYNVN